MRRTAIMLLALCALSVSLVPACRGQERAGRAFELDGLRVEVPPSWDGYVTRIGPDPSRPLIWVANVPFVEASDDEFPQATLRGLRSTGIVIEATAAPST